MGLSPAALTAGGAQTAQDAGFPQPLPAHPPSLPEAGLGHPPRPPPALPLASPVSSQAHTSDSKQWKAGKDVLWDPEGWIPEPC